MTKRKCKCGHTQEVIENKNIWQDIGGKFTVCESCNAAYGVEIKDKEYE